MHQIASQRIFISKNFRGAMPRDPLESLGLRPLGTSPPNGKSQKEPRWVAKMTGARDGASPRKAPLRVPFFLAPILLHCTFYTGYPKELHGKKINTTPAQSPMNIEMASKSSFYPQKVYSYKTYFISLRVWKGLIISEQLIF